MTLKTMHQILISSGIALGFVMMAFALFKMFLHHDASLVPTGVIGGVGAAILVAYLRWFMHKRVR